MPIDAFTSLLAAAALGATLLAVGYLALHSSTGTLVLLLAVWTVTVALRDSVDLSVTASSIRITALDVLLTILAVVGVSRALSIGVRGVGRGLAMALLLLLVVHMARGVEAFDMQTAINGGRGWLYFTAALVYASTVPGGWGDRDWKILAAAGVLLAAVAVPYLLIDGLSTATRQVYRNGEWVTSRPLAAAGALLILQSAILVLALRWPSRRTAVYAAVGTGAVVLLLAHRTLWVAAIVVGVVGFIWWSVGRVRDAEATVFAATGVVVLLLPVAVWGFLSTGALVESAAEATSSNSTFTWRTTSWKELLSSHDSVSQLATGEPSGADWSRLIGGQVINASPHNGFVDAYLRFGLPGVLIICWLGLLLWFRRFDVAAATGLTAQAVGLLLLTQLVFSVTYPLDLIQAMIAGMLVSGLVVASPVRASVPWRPTAPTPEYAIR